MCGRFTLTTPVDTLRAVFQIADAPHLGSLETPEGFDVSGRYNIAPTQPVATVLNAAFPDAHRRLAMLRWGLVPAWAKDPAIGNRMINARAETAADKPAFRDAFRVRRCLILADGFYEWQRIGARKQPFYIHRLDDRPFAFAGLWERWIAPSAAPSPSRGIHAARGDARGEPRGSEEGWGAPAVESCTILTTEPNELLRPIHDRMPVILDSADFDAWLDPSPRDVARLQPLLRPYPADELDAYPVGTYVNRPEHDGPECVRPQSAVE